MYLEKEQSSPELRLMLEQILSLTSSGVHGAGGCPGQWELQAKVSREGPRAPEEPPGFLNLSSEKGLGAGTSRLCTWFVSKGLYRCK